MTGAPVCSDALSCKIKTPLSAVYEFLGAKRFKVILTVCPSDTSTSQLSNCSNFGICVVICYRRLSAGIMVVFKALSTFHILCMPSLSSAYYATMHSKRSMQHKFWTPF